MCGRFTLTERQVERVARALAAEVDQAEALHHRPRWNVAPSERHWVVRLEGERRRLRPARFGLDGPRGKLLLNARSETAAERASFRRALADGRCLVPVDGFYEWRRGGGERRPLWFHPPAGGLLLLAGLAAEGDRGLTFAILTTAASGAVAEVHDRMPALLAPEAAEAWLRRGDLSLLAPAPAAALAAREVSLRVNVAGDDGPELLQPPDPPRQLALL